MLDDILEEIYQLVFSYKGWIGKYGDREVVNIEFQSQYWYMMSIEILLVFNEVTWYSNYGLICNVIMQLLAFFQGGKLFNYGPEMLSMAWILIEEVTPDKRVYDNILKAGLIKYITTRYGFKPIN